MPGWFGTLCESKVFVPVFLSASLPQSHINLFVDGNPLGQRSSTLLNSSNFMKDNLVEIKMCYSE